MRAHWSSTQPERDPIDRARPVVLIHVNYCEFEIQNVDLPVLLSDAVFHHDK